MPSKPRRAAHRNCRELHDVAGTSPYHVPTCRRIGPSEICRAHASIEPSHRRPTALKIGLISDVHADLQALDRVLEDLEAMKVDAILCAGDVVGYGPSPAETVARLSELKIAAVRGNHDRWAIERGAAMIDPYGVGPLAQTTIEYLRSLPP